MSDLYYVMSKILYDREEIQKKGDYLLKRKDNKNGFCLEISKNNRDIITVDYSKSGGVISNVSATQEELDIVTKELNSCLSKKSYVKNI